ncbi:MAG: hypothetical protein HXX13_05960 [Bacteroidetes bacterium]|nr:hypothetical protein [Bacteroidota bacterium]
MKNLLVFLSVICILVTACKKNTSENSTPSCLQNSINQFKLYACESNATVKEYKFQGKIVYLMEPGNCGADMASPVIDAECNSLGAIGGFTGNDSINGELFSNATYIRTVWHN